ncbi:hypothetical protein SLE2022_150700 [Rubroshorea leprosula]
MKNKDHLNPMKKKMMMWIVTVDWTVVKKKFHSNCMSTEERSQQTVLCIGEWRSVDKRKEQGAQEEFNKAIGDCVEMQKVGNDNTSADSDQQPEISSHSNMGKSVKQRGKNRNKKVDFEENGGKREAQVPSGSVNMDQAQETSKGITREEKTMGLNEGQTEQESSQKSRGEELQVSEEEKIENRCRGFDSLRH